MAKKRSRNNANAESEFQPLASESQVENTALNSEISEFTDVDIRPTAQPDFLIVGIGASAGGLEAFLQFLQVLPSKISCAIIFVQHMAPDRTSELPAILTAKVNIPVLEVADGLLIEPNKIYVSAPNSNIHITDQGRIHLERRQAHSSKGISVDSFFRELAAFAKEKAIAVVMSGSASDGAVGVRDIKGNGGIVMVQSPESAKFDGMPRAAIATDVVDLVLSPAQIASEIVRISERENQRAQVTTTPPPALDLQYLARIFNILRTVTGVDFSNYKTPTIRRRLQRRMDLQKIASVEQYTQFLEEHVEEAISLHRDILIHVTRFFREPESFEILRDTVFPTLIDRAGDSPIRIWIPGCATGEEAYSVAMALLEFFGAKSASHAIQIFATDVSQTAIEKARVAIYPENIIEDVTLDRIRRFFDRVDGSFQISKRVRDLCVFARQDLTRDPPFSRLDLIVCRNVLIYLAAPMQKKLMSIFHYGLKNGGFLMLGAAETVGPHSDLFSVVDKRSRVYAKRQSDRLAHPYFPVSYKVAEQRELQSGSTSIHSAQDQAKRLILEKYAPPGVIVDSNWYITQFIGQTGRFLEPAPGEASLNLLKMVREGLSYGLRAALRDVRESKTPIRRGGLHITQQGKKLHVEIEAIPLRRLNQGEGFYLVLFHTVSERDEPAPSKGTKVEQPQSTNETEQMAILQQELDASREYLQTIIQDMEAANEELQSANEEILSSNEELQSTNEELDTAKEELQSTNEELNTVNDELHNRNEELRRINNDLMNLLANVQIAIVMVDSNLRIRRFTPMAERSLNLIAGDIGRPIGHIKPNVNYPDLETLIVKTMQTGETVDREVQDQNGNWLSLRVRPYRGTDGNIDGAVLALFDIHVSKLHETELEQARDAAEAIIQAMQQPLVVLDEKLRITKVNRAFCNLLHIDPEEAKNCSIFSVGEGRWQVQQLRQLADQVLTSHEPVEGFKISFVIPERGEVQLSLTARRIVDGQTNSLLLAFSDDDNNL